MLDVLLLIIVVASVVIVEIGSSKCWSYLWWCIISRLSLVYSDNCRDNCSSRVVLIMIVLIVVVVLEVVLVLVVSVVVELVVVSSSSSSSSSRRRRSRTFSRSRINSIIRSTYICKIRNRSSSSIIAIVVV